MKFPVDITIHKGPKKPKVTHHGTPPKDIGARRRPIHEGGRRSTTTKAGIQFYDLGQRVTGETVILTLLDTVVNGDVIPDTAGVSTDLATLRDLYTTVAPSTLFATYKKIVKTSPLSKSVNVSYSKGVDSFSGPLDTIADYSGSALVIPILSAAALVVDGDGPFFVSQAIDFSDLSGSFKITSLPHYDAPAVAFAPSNLMDIAMPPAFAIEVSQVGYVQSGVFISQTLNGINTTIPRGLAPIFAISTYGSFYDIWRVMKASPGARAYSDEGGTWHSIPAADFAPVFRFPVPPAIPSPSNAMIITVTIGQFNSPEGALRAIIQKGGLYYYLWSNGIGSGYPPLP